MGRVEMPREAALPDCLWNDKTLWDCAATHFTF